MENFENNPRRVRQKNFYLLHLDTPRIIIIMTVIIGAIAGAFLLGMNFDFGDDKNNLAMKKNNLIIDEHKELGMLNGMPDLNDDEISTKNIPDDEDMSLESISKKETPRITKNLIEEPAGLTSGKNVEVVSAKTIQKSKKQRSIAQKEKSREKVDRTKQTKRVKKLKKPEKRIEKLDSNVVEVSSNGRNFKSIGKNSNHYAIQIASYDRKSKAVSEMNSLKIKHFNAYINKSKVNGKDYYRVRVGPFKSKKGAINLLDEIQGFQRYEESYMVKEKQY